MKKTYIFCTKWWLFLTEIPPIVILSLCIFYNNAVDTPQKLYPLIAFCCLAILFIFLYFFRLISISPEEIRTVGLFSSKDTAVVEKDKTLVFTLIPNNKIRVELYGKSVAPGLNWMKSEDDEYEINLYREKAIGGKAAVIRVLKSFGISNEECNSLFSNKEYEKTFDDLVAKSYFEDKNKIISIKFTKTI